jgi:predicted nucleotidyltransferase
LAALGRTGIPPEAVYLFGSFVSGAVHDGSDIDLAIVSSVFTGNDMDDQLRLMRLTWDIDVRIEPHPFRPEEFTTENPWAAESMRTGIKIV